MITCYITVVTYKIIEWQYTTYYITVVTCTIIIKLLRQIVYWMLRVLFNKLFSSLLITVKCITLILIDTFSLIKNIFNFFN